MIGTRAAWRQTAYTNASALTLALAFSLAAAAAVPARAQAPNSRPRAAAPRAWDLSLRAFAEFNDNIALDPEDDAAAGNRSSFALGGLVSGVWRYYEDLDWTLAAGGTTFHKQPLDGRDSDFRVTGVAPGLSLEHRSRPFDLPTRIRGAYNFRRDWVGGSGFSTIHTLGLAINVRPERELEVGPRLSVAFRDFDNDGADPDRTSRDATSVGTGFGASYTFGRRAPRVSASYGFSRSFAEGDDFDTEGHAVNARITQPVWLDLFGIPWPAPLLVSAFASYAKVEYVNFVGTPRRDQDNYAAGAFVYFPIGPNLSADVSYTYAQNDSSRADFASRRNTAVCGLTYRY